MSFFCSALTVYIFSGMCDGSAALNLLLFSVLRREKAEQVIWNRLKQLGVLKKKRLKDDVPLKIGVLGKSCLQVYFSTCVFLCLWKKSLGFF